MRMTWSMAFWVLAGYATGAVLGVLLVCLFSDNRHDFVAELFTTVLLLTGPLGGLIAAVAATARNG